MRPTFASLLFLLLTLSACATRTATPTDVPRATDGVLVSATADAPATARASATLNTRRLPSATLPSRTPRVERTRPTEGPRVSASPRPSATPTAMPWPTARAQIGTPPIQPAEVIAPENVARLAALAQWHEERVASIAWTAEGDLLAARGNEVVWYAYDGAGLVARKSVAFDDKVGALAANALWIAAQVGRETVVVWPAESTPADARTQMVTVGPDDWVLDVTLSGSHLIVQGPHGAQLWGLPSGARPLTRVVQAVVVALSADELLLATVDEAQVLSVRALADGGQVVTTTLAQPLGALLFSPDGQWLAGINDVPLTDRSVTLWRVTDLSVRWTAPSPDPSIDPWSLLAFTPDNASVVIASSLWVSLLRVSDGVLGGIVQEQHLSRIVFSGAHMAGLNWQGEVIVWEAVRARHPAHVVQELGAVECFTPDSATLILSNYEVNAIQRWQVETGMWQGAWRGLLPGFVFDGPFNIAQFTCAPGGRYFGRISGSAEFELVDLSAGTVITLWKEPLPSDRDLGFALAPDGAFVAVRSPLSDEPGWVIRTLPAGQVVDTGDVQLLSTALQFTPDGHGVAAYSTDGFTLYHWPEFTPWFDFAPPPDASDLQAVQFSADGTTLALVSARRVTIWDLAQNRVRTTWPLSDDPEHGAALSPDGHVLVTNNAWSDGLDLWDTSAGTHLRTLADISRGARMAFAPNGRWLAVGNDGGAVTLLGVP